LADPIAELFEAIEHEANSKAKESNADKCLKRLDRYFSRFLTIVPAKGNIQLYRLISKPQSIEALQDILSAGSGDTGLVIAPIRVLRSGRGARWIACLEPPKKYPVDCIVITVAMGGKLIRIVPEQTFIDLWGDIHE